MRKTHVQRAGGLTPPANRASVPVRLLAGVLCTLASLTLALFLAACTTQVDSGSAGSEAEVTDGTSEAQVTPSDPAGTVSVRDAVESETSETADDATDETSDEATGESGGAASEGTDEATRVSGALIYTNDHFGFVAELPAGYTETEPDLVTDTEDTVVLSAGDAKGDACLILTHTLPTEDEEAGEDRESTKAEDTGDTETNESDGDDASENDIDAADAASDEESGDDADEAVETVFDPIDDWARTYAAWVIAALEDEGAIITRSEIGRATLGGAPCVIVEIEFEPRGGVSEGEAGGAQRDLFFFDGRSDTSSVGLIVDCLGLSKEALDALENTFVAI